MTKERKTVTMYLGQKRDMGGENNKKLRGLDAKAKRIDRESILTQEIDNWTEINVSWRRGHKYTYIIKISGDNNLVDELVQDALKVFEGNIRTMTQETG